MKKIIKLYKGLVEKCKRLIKAIEIADRKTNGRFSSAMIVILSFWVIACIIALILLFRW